ncbi:ArfGAP with FG repeats 1 [Irineochytrium annulatum]|nr:ArfGAP with FG repeats 1 [Irineochytrium annulatum]
MAASNFFSGELKPALGAAWSLVPSIQLFFRQLSETALDSARIPKNHERELPQRKIFRVEVLKSPRCKAFLRSRKELVFYFSSSSLGQYSPKMSVRRSGEDKHLVILRALLKRDENKVEMLRLSGEGAVVCQPECLFRVKSVSASVFTTQEIQMLVESGGNEAARQVFLGTWNPSSFEEPSVTADEGILEFMRMKYIKRTWYVPKSAAPVAGGKSLRGSVSSLNLRMAPSAVMATEEYVSSPTSTVLFSSDVAKLASPRRSSVSMPTTSPLDSLSQLTPAPSPIVAKAENPQKKQAVPPSPARDPSDPYAALRGLDASSASAFEVTRVEEEPAAYDPNDPYAALRGINRDAAILAPGAFTYNAEPTFSNSNSSHSLPSPAAQPVTPPNEPAKSEVNGGGWADFGSFGQPASVATPRKQSMDFRNSTGKGTFASFAAFEGLTSGGDGKAKKFVEPAAPDFGDFGDFVAAGEQKVLQPKKPNPFEGLDSLGGFRK